jgi:hypothetical protein
LNPVTLIGVTSPGVGWKKYEGYCGGSPGGCNVRGGWVRAPRGGAELERAEPAPGGNEAASPRCPAPRASPEPEAEPELRPARTRECHASVCKCDTHACWCVPAPCLRPRARGAEGENPLRPELPRARGRGRGQALGSGSGARARRGRGLPAPRPLPPHTQRSRQSPALAPLDPRSQLLAPFHARAAPVPPCRRGTAPLRLLRPLAGANMAPSQATRSAGPGSSRVVVRRSASPAGVLPWGRPRARARQGAGGSSSLQTPECRASALTPASCQRYSCSLHSPVRTQ